MTTQFGTYLLFTLHTLHTQLILTSLLCNNQRNRKQQQDACLTNATQSFSITEATQDCSNDPNFLSHLQRQLTIAPTLVPAPAPKL